MAKSAPRHFEFKDGTSNKFWEVWVDAENLTTRWGRIGTDGQSKAKPFPDAAAAAKEMAKLIATKTREGYEEVGTAGAATEAVEAPPVKPTPPAVATPAPVPASAAAVPATAVDGKPAPRRFEFEDEESSKFWEVSVNGSDVTTKWGRIGTDGQSKTKTFADTAAANKEVYKLIASKTREGYEEAGSDNPFRSKASVRDHMKRFGGKKVVDWTGGGDNDDDDGEEESAKAIDFAKCAIRVGLTYEDTEESTEWADRFAQFVEQDGVEETTALIVGPWAYEGGTDSAAVIDALVTYHFKFPKLEALFIGEILSEEQEISWIEQTDLSPIFHAFPSLKELVIRGGTGLSLGAVSHASLTSLTIQTGGLDVSVVRQILAANLPELTHLEVWLGDEGYGANTTAADLAPLTAKGSKLFPKLQSLAIKDSEIADAIAVAFANADILQRIEELDFSMGTLSDVGGDALAASPYLKNLKALNLRHHYMTNECVARLKANAGGMRLNVSDQEEGGADDRYVEVSE